MTETGHGSDVQGLRTTATYDPGRAGVRGPHPRRRRPARTTSATRPATAAWPWSSPSWSRRGEQHGVHALLVPLRDEAGRPLPGVRIEDCGAKAGLGGVDNGRLAFDHVRVPREALLDRYAQVAPDGTYSSAIASPGRRFFTVIGALVRGRVSIAGAALSATKVGLDVAVRYGAGAPPVHRPGDGRGGAPARPPLAPAQAAARRGPRLRVHLRPGGAGRRPPGRARGRGGRRGRPPAGDRRRGDQGRRHLGGRPHAADRARGVRRRGLPGQHPPAGPARRHRRVHDLRGRQHRAHAAGGQEPAHRLRVAGRRAPRARSARPSAPSPPGRPTASGSRCAPTCSTRPARSRCCAAARSTCSTAWPGGCARPWRAGPRRRPRPPPPRTTCRCWAGPTSTGCWSRPSTRGCGRATTRRPRGCSAGCATCSSCPGSRRTCRGSWPTAGSVAATPRP